MRGNALFYNVGKCGHQKASPSGEAVGLVPTDEARNPPLPVADQGRCSANEATSFASVSAAKRLCRIERTIGHEMAVIMTNSRMTPLRRLHLIRAAKAAHLLLKENALDWPCFSAYANHCVSPHPSRYSLDAFSRLGEGSHSREFCKNHLTLLLQQSTHKASPWGKLANEMSLIR